MPTAPLAGLRVVVTRAAHQAGDLAAAFAAVGGHVETLPLLEVVPADDPRPLERAASELAFYDWLVLTSANAVEAFLPLAGGALPPRLQVATVGRATAAALEPYGIAPVLVGGQDAADLLRDLGPRLGRSRRVLLPQAADARPTLAAGLAAAGAEPVVVIAYDKRLPADAPRRATELFGCQPSDPGRCQPSGPGPGSTRCQPIGWVTFTSPRIVRHFAQLFGDDWERRRGELRAASLGRVTSAALRAAGVPPAAEAVTPSDEDLVAAVVRAVERAGA